MIFLANIQIFYFTKTGRSRAIAEELAQRYETQAHAITDGENWGGVLGFLKAGAKASKGDQVAIDHSQVDEDKIITVVFPVWAGKYPPALNSFLEGIDRSRVILIPTSLKTKFKDRNGYRNVIDLVGKDISAKGISLM